MHDDMHWLATDPQDKLEDDWAVDMYSFAWTCNAYSSPDESIAENADKMKNFVLGLKKVRSPLDCWRFNNRWASNNRN